MRDRPGLARLKLVKWFAAIATATVACGWCASPASAESPTTQPATVIASPFAGIVPLTLAADPEPESVYAPPAPMREDEGVNQGGVNFNLDVSFLSRYLYRGVIRFKNQKGGSSLNFQVDGKLAINTGSLPHPFVATFVNIDDDDKESRFQEVRPTLGFDWNLKPFLLTVGYIDYLFPEREKTNDTEEVFTRVEFDDSTLYRTPHPILSPYIYAAYDLDLYSGFYFEAGVSHDFPIEDTGISFKVLADVAYTYRDSFFRDNSNHDTGFQHYDVGVIGTYSLNNLFNVSKRYGEFDLKGYIYYTDGIQANLRSDTQLWGGGGVSFSY